MPSSNKEGKKIIKDWIFELQPQIKNILDLGTRNGNYHWLFAVKNGAPLRHCNWTGIEAWAPYIDEYNLKAKYNKIINEDIRKINYQQFGQVDMVFAGDVLEHMTKEEAVTVVDEVLRMSKFLIISLPIVYYPQDEVNGNPFEKHVKEDWSHGEMMETFPQIKRSWHGVSIGVYLLTSQDK